jgi:hypothetical protein
MWLNLRWARFFTLAGLEWKLANRPGFDFILTIPCSHSECSGSHILRVRVSEKTHDALARKHGELYDAGEMYTEPHPALFGDGPKNTHWQMPHGAGGGTESLDQWVRNSQELWERAVHD